LLGWPRDKVRYSTSVIENLLYVLSNGYQESTPDRAITGEERKRERWGDFD